MDPIQEVTVTPTSSGTNSNYNINQTRQLQATQTHTHFTSGPHMDQESGIKMPHDHFQYMKWA